MKFVWPRWTEHVVDGRRAPRPDSRAAGWAIPDTCPALRMAVAEGPAEAAGPPAITAPNSSAAARLTPTALKLTSTPSRTDRSGGRTLSDARRSGRVHHGVLGLP